MNKVKVSTENVMPLLMNYTRKTKIEKVNMLPKFKYNAVGQFLEIDMRIVGTTSLKSSTTSTSRGVNLVDKKNEIDDQKNVM
ncbi:hypothetical protein FACS1894199_08940 [Bacteroidia bacterium]|nr:hypothetical protein FACS1894199_08940 [Bacteroidia bacterium]